MYIKKMDIGTKKVDIEHKKKWTLEVLILQKEQYCCKLTLLGLLLGMEKVNISLRMRCESTFLI